MTRPANQRVRRAVNMLRALYDDGFDVSIIVEIAMAGHPAREKDAFEHQIVLDLYREEIGEKPKSEARLRGEHAMKAFLAEKAAAQPAANTAPSTLSTL